MAQDTNSLVTVCEGTYLGQCVVAGAIVHDQKLEILHGLFEDGLYRVGDEVTGIVGRYNY